MREKLTPVLKRGVLVFDSNFSRLQKNIAKSNFLENRVDTTSVLHGINHSGFLSKNRMYDLYVLNTLDPNSVEAFSDLALRFCDSKYYLNLLLIGPKCFLDEQIRAAIDLGAKIRVSRYETLNGHILQDKPLELDSILSSLEVGRVHYKRRPEQQKVKQIKKKIEISEQVNQQIYESIKSGMPDKEIMETFNLTPRQLGARKAWVSMRNTSKNELNQNGNNK